jgi:hypothetical protein
MRDRPRSNPNPLRDLCAMLFPKGAFSPKSPGVHERPFTPEPQFLSVTSVHSVRCLSPRAHSSPKSPGVHEKPFHAPTPIPPL